MLLEKWNIERDMDHGMPYIKQVLRNTNVSGGVVDVFQALAYDELVTGLEDHVNLTIITVHLQIQQQLNRG